MKVRLTVSDQFGPEGPQKGDILILLEVGADEDGDTIWFCARPSEYRYFVLTPSIAELVESEPYV